MARIYSIEHPDGPRRYCHRRADALSRGSALSDANAGATVIVRAHDLGTMPARELACALLNGEGFVAGSESVIGWFSGGKRRPELED